MSLGHRRPWHGCLGVVFILSAVGLSAAFAHDGKPHGTQDLWDAWGWEPWPLIGLTLAAWLYVRGMRRLWNASVAGRRRGCREAASFGAGWLTLWVALISPLHPLGRLLFSAHMIQHEILMVVATPLLVLARPLMPCLWGLPLPWRRVIGKVGKREWVQRGWHVLTNPWLAWGLQAVTLWIWHAPGLFQAALGSEPIHALQHLSFLLPALLFWWALIHGPQGRMGYGAAAFYVFATSIHSSALGALLTFAPVPWYAGYAGSAVSWGLTPLEDQQLAGLIMWVPAGALYLCAALALFAGWLQTLDAGGRQREGHARPQRQSAGVERGRNGRALPGTVKCVLLGGLLVTLVGLSACNRDSAREATELTGGDPGRGLISIRQHGCPSCHTIPGVPGAYGLVGPPLRGIASRMYIAGVLPNTPENMIRWIQVPQGVTKHTAMPNMGITESEARDIAGYLYTLK